MRARQAFLLACAAVTVAAGCGSGREQDASTVADRFYSAVAAKDGSAACAQLSEETVSKLESEEKASCSRRGARTRARGARRPRTAGRCVSDHRQGRPERGRQRLP